MEEPTNATKVAPDANVVKTIVSPDQLAGEAKQSVAVAPNGDVVVLIPMAEWKQCAQRGVRSFIQAAVLLLGGGTASAAATGLGLPAASVVGLPSTGYPVLDSLVVALLLGVFVALWNAAEFALDIDLRAPGWRA